MKIYNWEAFVIGLCVLALSTVMLIIERGDFAVWISFITLVVGVYVKSPIDWGGKPPGPIVPPTDPNVPTT